MTQQIHHGSPGVDVLLPYYRGATYIERALASLRAQSYQHWRLTVVDDHSNDGSLDYLRQLLDQDQGRSQLYVQDTNGGAAAARMRAAQETSAQLIAFLDQDDAWHPQKLQLQVEYMLENPDCGAVHSDVAFIEENDQVISGAGVDENARRALINWGGTREEVSRILFEKNSIRIISSMVRRSAFDHVGGFTTNLNGGEDWEFWTRFATKCSIHHIPEPLLLRRLHGKNTVSVQRYVRSVNKLEAWRMLVSSNPHLKEVAGRKRCQLLHQARNAARETGHLAHAALLGLRLQAQRMGLRI